MFDFSLSEILLTVVVAVVFIRPKDLPVVLRAAARGMAQFRALLREMSEVFHEVARESGVEEFKRGMERETRLITGDDGKKYKAYNVEDFLPAPEAASADHVRTEHE